MPELDQFEGRLAAAVHAFADRADTRVDPLAVAERAIGRRRFASLVWLGRPLPVTASILLVLGLLLALLAWSVGVGAPWDHRTSIVLLPAPTAAPTTGPSATLMPTTDGAGAEHVTGSGTFSIVDSGTSTQVGDTTQLRGFVEQSTDTMNDPRVSGTGTLRLSIDTHDQVGTEWGTYRLVNADGAWEGPLAGAAWSGGDASAVTGYLVGSGANAGWTYYIDVRSSGFATELKGIIFPGPPPGP